MYDDEGPGSFAVSSSTRTIGSDFAEFQSEYPLYKAHQPRYDIEWAYYQAGPATIGLDPLVFIHGTSGTAAAFFYQVQALAAKGYRVLSAQYPAYDTPEDWCKGLDLFLDATKCRAVHLFGAGLGGFLIQHFASRYSHRVKSLMLCNTFATTSPFAESAGSLGSFVHLTPTPLLRKVVLDAFPEGGMSLSAKQAIDWIAQQVCELSGNDLASRLSLNSTASTVETSFDHARVTILESSGETMVPDELRKHLRSVYSDARVALLKASGDFPYVSKPDEVSLFIEVHMRGTGVFVGAAAPDGGAAASATAAANAAASAAAVGSYAPASAASAPVERWLGLEEEEAAPPRRPVWKNPFEDDML